MEETDPLASTQPVTPIDDKKNIVSQGSKKWLIIGAIILFVIFAAVFVRRLSKTQPVSVNQNPAVTQSPGQNTNVSPNNITAISFDCLGNSACPELLVQGDPYATLPNGQPAGFHGYADPSMRKDPLSNKLWLAYSYPNIITVNNKPVTPGVDIHLSYSDDNGKTWHYQGPLWPTTPDTNKGGDGSSGYSANEVSNILPVQNGNSVTWYGIRSSYFVPTQGNYNNRDLGSFRLIISEASTPIGLATGKSAVLGSSKTSNAWGVNTNLSSLSPDVGNCDLLTEPALYYEKNTLYLISNCILFNKASSKINTQASNTVVFATDPTGDIQNFKWRYVGVLFHGADAAKLNLSGAEGFTQGDIVKGKDGKLLLIGSPAQATTPPNNMNHLGCWVFQVSSIDPPTLATDSSGNPLVIAHITASDLGVAGPGSCTYDPASDTGIIMSRRHLTSKPATSFLNITGIKP